jgi:Mg2+ and Co2+ transporter CorA
MYRIASLRTKAEMKSSSDLNSTMKRLTVIMTFLTIVSIVVSVPGTIGAILGIPALSNAYFENYTTTLVWVLIGLTLLSILLGYLYWKSLKMNSSSS